MSVKETTGVAMNMPSVLTLREDENASVKVALVVTAFSVLILMNAQHRIFAIGTPPAPTPQGLTSVPVILVIRAMESTYVWM